VRSNVDIKQAEDSEDDDDDEDPDDCGQDAEASR
jgi:hypothetical protein